MKQTICIVGRDARQKAAAKILRQNGYEMIESAEVERAAAVVFPMVMDETDGETQRALQRAAEGTLLLCGKKCPITEQQARETGRELVFYYNRPELVCLNAVPTAEGCLALLMQEQDETIWESDFLLLGYGHIGQAIAQRLVLLGGRVTVAARSGEQRALARCCGCKAIPLEDLPRHLPEFETVINTIPAKVLGVGELQCLPEGALILDLASKPGGTDFEAAKRMGLHAEQALSLPMRCAPQTAGRIVAQTVMAILEERRN